MACKILIVDDDGITRESLVTVLQAKGYVCEQAANGREGLRRLEKNEFDVVVSDIEMPEMDGIELLNAANKMMAQPPFIFITAHASVQTAVDALRQGAFDYLLKPLNFDDLIFKIEKLRRHEELLRENRALRQDLNEQYNFSNIIGESSAIKKIFATIQKVSNSESNVLITGASGTGKELVAKAIHYNSPHHRGRFVAVNCGAITETLIESELFGHKKGAFTGAVADAEGLFKAADHGTLFLDEIGEMSLTAQTKLLRAIETGEILPVGGTVPVSVHTRLIAATNVDLQKAVEEGMFRKDLYYRLAVIDIKIPSLKERKQDIPLLVRHFVKKYNRQMNKSITSIHPQLMQLLTAREWKGEVRELENFVERLMIFSTGSQLDLDSLPPDFASPVMIARPKEGLSLKRAVEEFEQEYILNALKKHNWHKGKTAKALGIGEATLYRKISSLDLPKRMIDD